MAYERPIVTQLKNWMASVPSAVLTTFFFFFFFSRRRFDYTTTTNSAHIRTLNVWIYIYIRIMWYSDRQKAFVNTCTHRHAYDITYHINYLFVKCLTHSTGCFPPPPQGCRQLGVSVVSAPFELDLRDGHGTSVYFFFFRNLSSPWNSSHPPSFLTHVNSKEDPPDKKY